MSIIENAKLRAEGSYGTGSGEIVITVLVIAPTYKAYKEFVKEAKDPQEYKYIYNVGQFRRLIGSENAVSKIQVLFLPQWHEHPDSLYFIRILHDLSSEKLCDLYSNGLGI